MSESEKVPWRKSAGGYGWTVAAEEVRPGGVLYLRFYDPEAGRQRRRSLGHRDKERAEEQAWELAHAIRRADEEERKALAEPATLGRVLDLYRRYRTPRKGETEQQADRRRSEMFGRVFGRATPPDRISTRAWEDWLDDRASGAIDARGRPVPEKERRSVRPGTVRKDGKWLQAVMRWAMDYRTAEGSYLLEADPLRGHRLPERRDPRRPAADRERYEKTLAVAGEVDERLRVMLVLAWETGQRLSAIRQLRYSDLLFDEGPHGSIRWRAEHQKNREAAVLPISAAAREAVGRYVRERPGIGEGWLLPHTEEPTRPVSKHIARRWLLEAEEKAGLDKLDGALWHAYRRAFATEMLAVTDVATVAKLGNWKTPHMVTDLYAQPAEARQVEALERREQLGEAPADEAEKQA